MVIDTRVLYADFTSDASEIDPTVAVQLRSGFRRCQDRFSRILVHLGASLSFHVWVCTSYPSGGLPAN